MSKLISVSVEKKTRPLPSHPETPSRQEGESRNPGSDGVLAGETPAFWSPGRAWNCGNPEGWLLTHGVFLVRRRNIISEWDHYFHSHIKVKKYF